jgi:hypothetical protein
MRRSVWRDPAAGPRPRWPRTRSKQESPAE